MERLSTEEIIEKINRYLIKETDFLRLKDTMKEDQLRLFVDRSVVDLCTEHNIFITTEQRMTVIRHLVSAVLSLGPLRPLVEDQDISEIMVNGYNKIYVQKNGRLMLTNIKFDDNQHLMHTIQKILASSGTNKRVDESSPYVDFSLNDGSRVNVILQPCSLAGPVMTIRRFSEKINTVDDLVHLQMFDKNIATLLIAAMQAKLNVIFCGSTGAGKTTMLNVLSRHIPEHERIVTIEDTPELRLLQDHVVPLVTKSANVEGKGQITMRELFVNSLRMRPDRVIIGEIRSDEMLDLIQSITSGHSGSLAIVHAESPEDCFSRMVTMMLMTGIRLSTEEIKRQIAKAIDLIVHVELFLDGKRRVTSVAEPAFDEETGRVSLPEIFCFEQKGGLTEKGVVRGDWVHNKRRPNFCKKLDKKHVKLPAGFFE